MKDLEIRNIFPKNLNIPKRLSVYKNGNWQFTTPANPIKVDKNQTFYRVNEAFGITNVFTDDPSKTIARGGVGDILIVLSTGTMRILPNSQYVSMYPDLVTIPPTTRTVNSLRLKDPNYITEVAKGSGKPISYNMAPTTRQAPMPSKPTGCNCSNR